MRLIESACVKHKIFAVPLSDIYPLYVKKVERKGRGEEEVRQVITWLTQIEAEELDHFLASEVSLEEFFAATTLHPNVHLITGSICGYKVQEIEDPLMRSIRYMDKLVDELAKGKSMEKILRVK